MSKYRIVGRVVTDSDFLHQKSEEVDPKSAEAQSAKRELLDQYKRMSGAVQGLAAIQLGIKLSVILVRWERGIEPIVMFNPKVRWSVGNKNSNEGCISEGEIRYIVKRPVLAGISYEDSDGKRINLLLNHRKARIFCHEYDHTKGILLADHGKAV